MKSKRKKIDIFLGAERINHEQLLFYIKKKEKEMVFLLKAKSHNATKGKESETRSLR